MKTASSLSRTLPIVAALGLSLAFVCETATAARGGGGGHAVAGGWHGGAGGWHGGPGGWHGGPGHYRGGNWGYRGRYWPGAFWGGIGLGLGIGAIGYYGGYYGGYWGPYYRTYEYDAPLVVAPVYVDPGMPRTGQPVPQAPAAPDPIFYPNHGQSAQALESDRRECNRWATTQSGAMADASIFQRATLACMEGRGYTVK
jgi:hypothetical protein